MGEILASGKSMGVLPLTLMGPEFHSIFAVNRKSGKTNDGL